MVSIHWFQESEAEAEERARQAEELLAQMSDIASSLRRPILELVHENKNHPDHERYRLRNNIGHPVTILEVMNLQEFFVRYCDIPELPAEVHRGNPVNFSLPHDVTVKSLELRIKVSGKEETLFVRDSSIVRAFNIKNQQTFRKFDDIETGGYSSNCSGIYGRQLCPPLTPPLSCYSLQQVSR